MNFKYFLVCITLISSCSPIDTKKEVPLAKNGVIDLRHWDFDNDGPVELNGEWLFYWKKLLSKGEKGVPFIFEFPGTWTRYKSKDINLEKYGYGTFIIDVLLPQDNTKYSLIHSNYFTERSYFINGHFLESIGEVSKTPSEKTLFGKIHLHKEIPRSITKEKKIR